MKPANPIKNKVVVPLNLYEGCYDSKEVATQMRKQNRLKKWQKWFYGSTGKISKDGKRLLVFPWDLERFIEGLSNED